MRPSTALRILVIERAGNCCEYCLIHQNFTAASHPVDHVVAEKHGGVTASGNLALSRMVCNLRKGSDIASLDPVTGHLVPLFHPRRQKWVEHFVLGGTRITGISEVGRTTVEFLRLNDFERLIERKLLIQAGVYPRFRG